MKYRNASIRNTSVIVLLSLLLVACGGATQQRVATTTFTPPPPPPPPPPPVEDVLDAWRTDEFNLNWGLGAIGAEHAYEAGFTGAGQIIGFVDFNFDFSSPEINFHPASLGPDPESVAIYEAQIGEPAISDPHGQAVAVVAGGVRNGADTHGVAYGAQILAVDFFSGTNPTQQTVDGVVFNISNVYTYLMDNGARVVSLSIGFDDDDFISNPPVVTEKYVLSSPLTVINEGGLLVLAAGNNSDPEPQLSNLNIRRDADEHGLLVNGPGALLMVGSVDENNIISSFSDKAGEANKDIFLVAPGEGIVAPWVTEEDGAGLFFLSGTSFAAPHVAGAAAILFQRWPSLTAKDVAEILLTTATDLGDPGVDFEYGHGLLNLEEAIKPQGGVTASIFGNPTPVGMDDFSLMLGAPFGDMTPTGLSNVMGLDKFNRDFYFDLTDGVYNSALERRPLISFMEQNRQVQFNQWQAGGQVLGLQVSEDYSEGFLKTQSQFVQDQHTQQRVVSGFVEGKISQNWAWKMGLGSGLASSLSSQKQTTQLISAQGQAGFLSSSALISSNHGLLERHLGDKTTLSFGVDISSNNGVQWHFAEQMRENLPRYAIAMQIDHQAGVGTYGLRLGQMIEKQSVLGSRSFGGFAVADAAVTSFVGLEGMWRLSPAITLNTSLEAGLTNVNEVAGSFFEGFNNFASTAWRASLSARDIGLENSNLVFSASQPLRVENAVLSRHQAIGLDAVTGATLYEQISSPFSPSGREMNLEAAYALMGRLWSLQASIMYRIDAGHRHNLNDTAGLIWLKRRF